MVKVRLNDGSLLIVEGIPFKDISGKTNYHLRYSVDGQYVKFHDVFGLIPIDGLNQIKEWQESILRSNRDNQTSFTR